MNISPILKKFLAGKPTGMMSRASVQALLDAAKSALLADPKISDEIEALRLEALRVGQSHDVFNQAELPHACDIIAKAEACLAKDAMRKARAASQSKNAANHYPVKLTKPSAMIPIKPIATLPKPRKKAPPTKATQSSNKLTGASYALLTQAATHRSSPPAEKAAARAELAAAHGVTITESGIVSHSQRGGRAVTQSQKSK